MQHVVLSAVLAAHAVLKAVQLAALKAVKLKAVQHVALVVLKAAKLPNG